MKILLLKISEENISPNLTILEWIYVSEKFLKESKSSRIKNKLVFNSPLIFRTDYY